MEFGRLSEPNGLEANAEWLTSERVTTHKLHRALAQHHNLHTPAHSTSSPRRDHAASFSFAAILFAVGAPSDPHRFPWEKALQLIA